MTIKDTEEGCCEEISEEEKQLIEEGVKQLDRGEGIPHEEAIKRLIWFPK